MTRNELLKREAYYSANSRIVKTEDGYEAQVTASYFTDSCNPKGEYKTYWDTLKVYKTFKGALNGLMKHIDCRFPKGYDISGIREAIEAR